MKNQIALMALTISFWLGTFSVQADEACDQAVTVANQTFGRAQDQVVQAIQQSLDACQGSPELRDLNVYRSITNRCNSIQMKDITVKSSDLTSELLDLSRIMCRFHALNYALSLSPTYESCLEMVPKK